MDSIETIITELEKIKDNPMAKDRGLAKILYCFAKEIENLKQKHGSSDR